MRALIASRITVGVNAIAMRDHFGGVVVLSQGYAQARGSAGVLTCWLFFRRSMHSVSARRTEKSEVFKSFV
jgi:hypothetical protein